MALDRIKAFALGEESHDGSFLSSVVNVIFGSRLLMRLLMAAVIVSFALGLLWAAIRIVRWMWDTPIF